MIGNALVGLLAGLPLVGRPGREVTVGSVLAIVVRSAFSVTLGFTVMTILSLINQNQRVGDLLLAIPASVEIRTLPTVIMAVLLLPLLFACLPPREGYESEITGLARETPMV